MSIELPIGKNIRKYRKEKGMTQQEVADRLKVNRSVVQRYETGLIEVPLSRLPDLAAILDTSMSDLMGLDEYYVELDRRDRIEERMRKSKEFNKLVDAILLIPDENIDMATRVLDAFIK